MMAPQTPRTEVSDSSKKDRPPGGLRTNRRPGQRNSWPDKQLGANPTSVSPLQGSDLASEGLCHSMPEIGMMPFKSDLARGRQVVRLVSSTPGAELSIELQPGLNRVGRQRENNHIVLVSPQVSRFHAELDVRSDEIVLRDLGSANGSFVNGQRITTQTLHAGDTIAFSDQFALQLLIDLAVEEPDSLTYDSALALAPQTGLVAGSSVPRSLEARLESSPGLDAARLDRLPSAPPLRIASARSVEIALPVSESNPTNKLPSHAAAADPAASPWISEPRTDPELVDARTAAEANEFAFDDVTQFSGAAPPAGMELAEIDRERRRLAVLYQVSKRCMAAESLDQLDALLITVLERVLAFERGFITYQLPSGDWKLVMSPRGEHWERSLLRDLVQKALQAPTLIRVKDSYQDGQLGREATHSDCRVLLPLHAPTGPVGAVFLLARNEPFDDGSVDFLTLFGDIAALAIVHCIRLEGLPS